MSESSMEDTDRRHGSATTCVEAGLGLGLLPCLLGDAHVGLRGVP